MPDLPARTATVERQTAETTVRLTLDLDGGTYRNATGVGFLDHMLDLFARHGQFGLTVEAEGDLHVDDHHTVEDVGICLGRALGQALGDKTYVARYGEATVPMDEALARAVVDLSGRAYLVFEGDFRRDTVGDLSTELVEHFWWSVAEHARLTLHLDVLRGRNDHHKVEAVFKAAARALRAAVARDATGDRLPSTKEAL
ncbi:imidazoleglycerol-phosphate dehydratase HisB [Rubrivirga sp. S365]|uniref:Imidazoleglycerol-phosphate dehydratase n=1 Tax=Rubrivirga litoralis TaxID=3075598 RepID=A0ABU3BTH0_9BACT|nr:MULTISPECIES: imidazoleglycerol-phosphate dehydratase HisB [unclassified Rubrivirga]MDT0632593.1 imidazoleglycerol-phosphate dehydratase HisB [Rubrivirga sp. F394]MDT7856717.1 imidazoleglycerol-phosphate dehydratase HisB [Rubrivirga sp. S365]